MRARRRRRSAATASACSARWCAQAGTLSGQSSCGAARASFTRPFPLPPSRRRISLRNSLRTASRLLWHRHCSATAAESRRGQAAAGSILPPCAHAHNNAAWPQVTDSAGVCKEPPIDVPPVNPVTNVPNAAYGYSDGAALPCVPVAKLHSRRTIILSSLRARFEIPRGLLLLLLRWGGLVHN